MANVGTVLVAAAVAAGPVHSVRLGRGSAAASFVLREPGGVILDYRISAPAGTRLRAWTQIPGTTAPLEISMSRPPSAGACRRRSGRLVCSQGEEWCSMTPAAWSVRILKRSGPAGMVRLRFVVGTPPHHPRAARRPGPWGQ